MLKPVSYQVNVKTEWGGSTDLPHKSGLECIDDN